MVKVFNSLPLKAKTPIEVTAYVFLAFIKDAGIFGVLLVYLHNL